MKIGCSMKNGDYIESESGERVRLYYPFDKEAIIKAWEFGLEEAWETARKLSMETEDGGMDNKSIKEAFGGMYFDTVFKLFTAKEAIQKIKEYEGKKAEKGERIEYLKHEYIKKDGKTVRVWNGGTDSRCRIREEEKGHFLKKALEETKDSYKKMIEEAISETLERMNENKSEEGKEKEMKTGDKFIIELGEKTRIQSKNSKGEWKASDEFFRIDGTGSVISAKDLMNLKEYKENNDEKENVKYVSPEMLEKINITPGKGMEKFQEEKAQRADVEKGSAVGKKFVIEIEKEEEGCYFELKGTNERYFETVCKIKGTNAYIKKADLDKLEKREEKKKEEEVKVGDEIESSEQIEKAVVLWIEADGYWGCLQNDLFFTVNDKQKKYWKKTGKHYDEVEKIFQKLKESEGEISF